MKIWIVAIAAAVITASGTVARADSAADARAAFQRGVTHFDAGRFQEAAVAFREANRLSPSWRIYYNIGQCEAALKRYGDALDAFDQYLAEGGDEIDPAREEEVLEQLERLRLKVGTVLVTGPSGIEVIIDDVARGVTPADAGIRVTGGVPHTLVLEKGGAELLRREFKVGNGQQIVVDAPAPGAEGAAPAVEAPKEAGPAEGDGAVPAEKAEDAPAPADEKPRRRISPMFGAGIGVGVAGVGLLVVGGAFRGKGQGDYDDYEAAAARGDEPEYTRLRDDVLPVDNALIATGFVGGGVLVALGVTLMVVDKVRNQKEEPAKVAVAPAPGGLAVSF